MTYDQPSRRDVDAAQVLLDRDLFCSLCWNFCLKRGGDFDQITPPQKRETRSSLSPGRRPSVGERLAELETGLTKDTASKQISILPPVGYECAGGAAHHRGEGRQKIFHGSLSRFAIPFCPAHKEMPWRKSIGRERFLG
jgi:hypothetical protein